MDRLTSIAIFKRVAESGSFSDTARETGLSQPTISKHIARLEDQLGVRLLNRSTRRTHLTEAGERFYETCTRIVTALDEASSSIGQLQSSPTGTLRINVPVTFGRLLILPRIPNYLAQYPGITADLIFNDRYIDLVAEGVDLAIRLGNLTDSSLVGRRLGTVRRVAVAARSYLDRYGEPLRPGDLSRHNCIVNTNLSTVADWHFSSPEGEVSVRVTGRFRANNSEAVAHMVRIGAGIAVVPEYTLGREIADGTVQVVLRDYAASSFEIHALYPATRHVLPKVRSFLDFLSEAFREEGLFQ